MSKEVSAHYSSRQIQTEVSETAIEGPVATLKWTAAGYRPTTVEVNCIDCEYDPQH